MQTRLYLVRHGQTQFNVEGKRQGHLDSPLTELGKKQAAAARDWFKKENIHLDEAWSSDLGRAVHTCQIITEGKMPIHTSSQLQEVSYGSLDGTTLPKPPMEEWEAGAAHDYGGETFLEAWQRAHRCLMEIAGANPGKNVLVVSHSALMVMMEGLLDTVSGYERRECLPNGCVMELIYSSGRLWIEDCINPADELQAD